VFGLKQRRAGPRTEEQANAKARKIGVFLLTFALPALIIFLAYRMQFRGLNDSNTMEMGQIARNIMNGKGFVSSSVRPLAIAISNDKTPNLIRMPDVIQAPLYPLVLTLPLATGGTDKHVFITSVLFFFLTIPVLLALSRAMFNQRVAYFTLFAYAASILVIGAVVQAGPGTLLMFLFTSLCLALYRYVEAASPAKETAPDPKQVRRLAILTGILTALCYLADYMLLFMLVPVAVTVYLTGGEARKKGFAAFLVAFLVPAGAWWIRNLMVGVNPFFGLRILEIGMATTDFPGMSLYRHMTPQTTLGVLQQVKGEVLRKVVIGVMSTYQNLMNMGAPYLMAFFIAGLFYSFRRVGVNAVRGFLLAAFFCVMLFGSVFFMPATVLGAFLPVFLAFSAAFFIRLVTDARVPASLERLIIGAGVVVVGIPMVYTLAMVKPGVPPSRQSESVTGRVVAGNTPLTTDRPFDLAWYSGRTCVWLPRTEDDVKKLEAIRKQGAIYLSSSMPRYSGTEFDIWQALYANAASRPVNTNGPEFMRITEGPLAGFALYRDLPPEQTQVLARNGNLLFMRPEGVRKEG